MQKLSPAKLHRRYIRGTPVKTIVQDVTVLLCRLTRAVQEMLNIEYSKVYLTTKCLKHIYDSKPAEEYDAILQAMIQVVAQPEEIYENKSGKRGNLCFVKQIKGDKYFCSLEQDDEKRGLFVATCFRLRKEGYLNDYRLLWSWKSGESSS